MYQSSKYTYLVQRIFYIFAFHSTPHDWAKNPLHHILTLNNEINVVLIAGSPAS